MSHTPNSIRVLHVDDEPGTVDTAAGFVERTNDRTTVGTAVSASGGLDRLAADDFDRVVSDYQAPGTNGVDLLEAACGGYPGLPPTLRRSQSPTRVSSGEVNRRVWAEAMALHGETRGTGPSRPAGSLGGTTITTRMWG